MSVQTTLEPPVAKKSADSQPAEQPRDRVDLRIDPSLAGRAKRQADRLGMSLSAYMRMALTRQVESDEATEP